MTPPLEIQLAEDLKTIEDYKGIQKKVEVNLRALEIILSKFQLFKATTRDGVYDREEIMDSYREDGRGKFRQEIGLEEIHTMSTQETTRGTGKAEGSNTTSILLKALEINQPRTVNLFLQQQSNKITHLVTETTTLLEEFGRRHGQRLERALKLTEIRINRHINRNIGSSDGGEINIPNLRAQMDRILKIKDEIGRVTHLCLGMDLFPQSEALISDYLRLISEINFVPLFLPLIISY